MLVQTCVRLEMAGASRCLDCSTHHRDVVDEVDDSRGVEPADVKKVGAPHHGDEGRGVPTCAVASEQAAYGRPCERRSWWAGMIHLSTHVVAVAFAVAVAVAVVDRIETLVD